MCEAKSPQQVVSETEYWMQQKQLIEQIVSQLNQTKLTIFNFWKVYRLLKRLIAIIGIGTTTILVQQAQLWETLLLLNESNASLNRQNRCLHERLKKLEERKP